MEKPSLGVIKGSNVNITKPLTAEEFIDLEKAMNRLLLFSSNMQLLNIVDSNFIEFINTAQTGLVSFAHNKDKGSFKTIKIALELNRRLLNFLSSLRMYLDHHETRLSRTYGKKSLRLKNFKLACSNEYDSNFSYRFLYRLRNYSQHSELPIGSVSISGHVTNWATKETEHELGVFFDPKELLENFDKWGPQLTSDLSLIKQKFSVISTIKSMMKSIQRINMALYQEEIGELIDAALHLTHAFKDISTKGGIPFVFETKDFSKEIKPFNLPMRQIPLHIIDIVKSTFPEQFISFSEDSNGAN